MRLEELQYTLIQKLTETLSQRINKEVRKRYGKEITRNNHLWHYYREQCVDSEISKFCNALDRVMDEYETASSK